jgi:hypothetical protein
MVFVIWVVKGEASPRSQFPRLQEARIARLNDECQEEELISIKGKSASDAADDEVLADWKLIFETVYTPLGEDEQRVLAFPQSKQRIRFYYLKDRCGYGNLCDTHYGSLGSLLVEDSDAEHPGYDINSGIPKMIEILEKYGIEYLIRRGYLKDSGVSLPRRERVFSNTGYQHFGDTATHHYHLRTCERLDYVKEEHIVGLGKNPHKKGWHPCPFCIKDAPIVQSIANVKTASKSTPKTGGSTLTKAQIIKHELSKACAEYGMHAEYAGGTVFVTTVAGEWFFDFNDRPIRLHHKNYTERAKELSKTLNHYHLQSRKFASPLQALRYISEHDLELKRRMMQDVEGEMAADSYFFGDTDINLVNKAIVFAANAHNGDVRKGSRLPYILHPMEAATIAATITDDEEVIAAAALHDVIEDTDVKAARIQIEFGERVLKLVQSDSEDKRPELPPAETWQERKQETINYLKSIATTEERIVALADKLSNIRACHRDHQRLGDAMWEKFNMSDKEMQGWYYKSIRDALSGLQDTDAWKELDKLVTRIFPE